MLVCDVLAGDVDGSWRIRLSLIGAYKVGDEKGEAICSFNWDSDVLRRDSCRLLVDVAGLSGIVLSHLAAEGVLLSHQSYALVHTCLFHYGLLLRVDILICPALISRALKLITRTHNWQ